MQVDRRQFEELVGEALDSLPLRFAELLSNVVVQVREAPDRETLLDLGLDPRRDTLFGLYTGVSLDRRGDGYGNVLPDVIFIYRRPLLAACASRRELLAEIRLTVLHEIGHHFGLGDTEMHAWEAELEAIE